MASGWDVATKKVIRFNSRNHGSNIWVQDALAPQNIDPEGHDVNDQTLADSISDTLNINGINAMAADLQMGGFKVVGAAPGTAAGDGATVGQITSQGMTWTMQNASGNLALGKRWAGLFFGADITYTLPAISGDLAATGPTDIWVFNGCTNKNIILDPSAGAGGHLYVNGVSLAAGATQVVLPGQMAVIIQTGSLEAQAWNVVLVNAGDPAAYGPTWAGNTRPPTKNAVYNKLEAMIATLGKPTEQMIWANQMFLPSTGGAAALASKVDDVTHLGYQHLAFDDSVDEYAEFNFKPPDGWNGGSVSITIYWAASTNSVGSVGWLVHQLRAINNGESAFQVTPSGSGATSQAGSGTAFMLQTVTDATVEITRPGAAGDIVQGVIRRNGSTDALVGDAHLIGLLVRWVNT